MIWSRVLGCYRRPIDAYLWVWKRFFSRVLLQFRRVLYFAVWGVLLFIATEGLVHIVAVGFRFDSWDHWEGKSCFFGGGGTSS